MFDPCFQHWQRVRWENAQSRRYYEARVIKNLLDEWEVFCVWGGIGTPVSYTHLTLPTNREV